MGLLDKVKNMFTEEVEEKPIKKEVMQVEIPAPTAPEEKTEELSDSETIKKEDKFSFPVFFDDQDFASLEKPKPKPELRVSEHKLETKYNAPKVEKKVFKPTPIISPVYGVLDKNYHKDDITPKKKETKSSYYEPTEVTIDDVRRKAFGTLEDDLATSLVYDEPSSVSVTIEKTYEPKDDEQTSANMLDELMENDYKPKYASKDEPIDNTLDETLEEIDGTLKELDVLDSLKEEKDESEKLTNSDLFNLIDSMYEKGEDE